MAHGMIVPGRDWCMGVPDRLVFDHLMVEAHAHARIMTHVLSDCPVVGDLRNDQMVRIPRL